MAQFDPGRGIAVAPLHVTFDASASYSKDAAAHLVSWSWDFGDGERAQGVKVDHVFASPGSYPVTVTAVDSDGESGTAALHVEAQKGQATHWVRSGGGGGVGTDFENVAVSAAGQTLERFDPLDGHTIWQRELNAPNDGPGFNFQGPVFIAPSGEPIFAMHDEGNASYSAVDSCIYRSSDGLTEACLAGELLDRGNIGSSMGAGGELATADFSIGRTSATVRKTDGGTWSFVFWEQSDGTPSPTFWLGPVTAEPGGDLIATGTAQPGFTVDGHEVGPGAVMLRISEGGKLVWWRSLPGSLTELSTSAFGTIVALVDSPSSFSWGGQNVAAGSHLLTIERDGAERWSRTLPSADAHLAVLPAGQAAVVINHENCGGPEVRRYNLAGDLIYSEWMPSFHCDATYMAVGILPHDVIISGIASNPIEYDIGQVPAGPFLLDVHGP